MARGEKSSVGIAVCANAKNFIPSYILIGVFQIINKNPGAIFVASDGNVLCINLKMFNIKVPDYQKVSRLF